MMVVDWPALTRVWVFMFMSFMRFVRECWGVPLGSRAMGPVGESVLLLDDDGDGLSCFHVRGS